MEKYGTLMGISEISRYAGIPRMSFYSRRSDGKRGRKPSSFTVRNADGIDEIVSNTSVVNVIEDLLSREFVCYGYKKTTKHLQNSGYRINRKKVRRLMRENRLLNHSYNGRKKVRRVIDRKLSLGMPNEVWEMDIKYVWIHGESRNAFLFILMDCFTREEIGHYMGYSCRKDHVRMVMEFAFHDRGSDNIRNLRIRSDNGSQFIARMTGDYLSSVNIPHERIHPATPQEDGHIEAMNSIIERELIRRFEFDSLEDAKNIIDRYMMFYNEERIHSAIGYMTPREMYEKWMEKSQEA